MTIEIIINNWNCQKYVLLEIKKRQSFFKKKIKLSENHFYFFKRKYLKSYKYVPKLPKLDKIYLNGLFKSNKTKVQ